MTPGTRRAPAGRCVGESLHGRESGELARSRRAGGESALANLVEERLVADLENSGRLGSIPMHLLEHLRERLALRFSRPAARDVPQALGNLRPRSLDEPEPAAVEKGLNRLF